MSDNVQLSIQDVSLSFGGLLALNNVSFAEQKGEILAIIGPNGAGKTSLLNCLNNFYRPDKDQILFGAQKSDKTSQNSTNVEEFLAGLRFEQRGKLDELSIHQ